jgi:cell division protein FtsW (lipid II flippase)
MHSAQNVVRSGVLSVSFRCLGLLVILLVLVCVVSRGNVIGDEMRDIFSNWQARAALWTSGASVVNCGGYTPILGTLPAAYSR